METSYLISDDMDIDDISSSENSENNEFMIQIGSKVALELLGLRTQVKVIHWQTKSYSEHKALDKLFDILDKHNDRWVETFMGKYGRVYFNNLGNKLNLKNLEEITDNNADMINYLKDWVTRIRPIRDKYFGDSSNSDLSNIFDEIFGDIDRTCYLLSLH